MSNLMKSGANHLGNYGGGWILGVVGLYLLDRLGWLPAANPEDAKITALRSAIEDGLIVLGIFAAHRVRPFFDAFYNRALRWAKGGAPAAAVLLALSGALSGCGTAYYAAVDLYVSTLPKRGAIYYGAVEPELRKELVLNDAALACLVDEEHDRSPSPACVCSKGRPDTWETNCAAWLALGAK
jgi:hypothetical protein